MRLKWYLRYPCEDSPFGNLTLLDRQLVSVCCICWPEIISKSLTSHSHGICSST